MVMAFDYKKEYKEYYLPKDKPSIVTVPAMNYIGAAPSSRDLPERCPEGGPRQVEDGGAASGQESRLTGLIVMKTLSEEEPVEIGAFCRSHP